MGDSDDFSRIPVVDVSDLIAGREGRLAVARQLAEACAESGFFYAIGHGVDLELQRELRLQSRRLFALPSETKLRIRMALGGRAWRGYFARRRADVGETRSEGGSELRRRARTRRPTRARGHTAPRSQPVARRGAGAARRSARVHGGPHPARASPAARLRARSRPRRVALRRPLPDDAAERWDGASVHAFAGTYRDYVLAKVGKVFPELHRSLR